MSPQRVQRQWEVNFRTHMKRLREKDGMTQTELARRLKFLYGLPFHQQTIQRIESGERPVRVNEGYLIADTFGVSLDSMTQAASLPDPPDEGVAAAVLALADEQHTRNRLAAITAAHRGITLPPDLQAPTEEGHLP